MKKYFGTDGIRGKVGEIPITPDFVLKLGWAIGRVLGSKKNNRVVIGKDTRISGYMLESVLEAGLSAAGVDILLLGPMPTAAVAYLTRTFHAQAGIVISASHNPYFDNGIKFFSPEGKKLPDEIEFAIEVELVKALTTVSSDKLGKAKRIDDAVGRYVEFCKSTFAHSHQADLTGLKIILDCAHGATYQVAPLVFRELGAEVYEIASIPNGLNINENCGAVYPENLRKHILERQADLGIAFDGDGDRVIMMDHKGEIVDGDELIFILADYLKPHGVVGTQMSNLGLELAMHERKIDFVRTKVGDRYVIDELEKRQWKLGGESSGHIICRALTTTGDGIIAALQVLSSMVISKRSLHELKKGMHKFPQHLINVKFNDKEDITSSSHMQAIVKSIEKQLGSKGRVLLRPSGTEPLVRVMVEGEDEALTFQLAKYLAEEVRKLT